SAAAERSSAGSFNSSSTYFFARPAIPPSLPDAGPAGRDRGLRTGLVTPALQGYLTRQSLGCDAAKLGAGGIGTLNPLVEGPSPSALTTLAPLVPLGQA